MSKSCLPIVLFSALTRFLSQHFLLYTHATALLFFVCTIANAQNYGNEWIDHNQTYYKIKVGKDALYRIPYSTLQNAGLPAQATGYHLFRNGTEVPIYISSNDFNNANDYIEFYGKKNDGSLDTQLYAQATQQASPYKSLFSDTSAYFLVWKPDLVEALFNPIANNIANAPAPMPYFMHQQTNVIANEYNNGRPLNISGINHNPAFFDECEGWISLLITAPNTFTYNVNTPAIYNAANAPNTTWKVKIAGRSDDAAATLDHHLRLLVNGTTVADTTFTNYDCISQQFSLPATTLTSPQTQLNITPVGDTAPNDAVSVAYYQVNYPRLFDFSNQTLFEFTLPHNNAAYLEISNFNGGTEPVLYDLSNLKRVTPILENGLYKINLNAGNNTNQPRRLVLGNTTAASSLITITQLTPRTFVDYSQAEQQGNYVIIAAPALMEGDTNTVAQYANYRRSNQGGSHSVSTANIEELYDQFAYGTAKHPLAIARFINYAIDTFDSIPTQLLLLGKATTVNRFSLPASYNQCLVPTYGVQPSDVLLAARSRNNPLPQVAVGRVPAQTANELKAYLNKVKQYENEFTGFVCADTATLWRRKVIGLATENDQTLYNNAINTVRAYADSLSIGYFAADTLGIYAQFGEDNTPLPQFEQAMNSGVGLVLFAGKQANNYWRMQVGAPSTYNNQARYPFIISQSDFIGNIHGQQPTMANDFVLAEQGGAIGFMDNAARALPNSNNQYMSRLIAGLRSTDYANSIGTAQKNAIQAIYGNDPNDNFIALTYTLCGDPALSIVPAKKTELLLNESDLMLYNPNNIPIFGDPANITSNMSHFEARLQVWNIGKNTGDSCRVRVKRWLPNNDIVDVLSQKIAVPRTKETVSLIIPNNLPNIGINTFFFTVDYGNEIPEMCETNNTITKATDIDLYVGTAPILADNQYRAYPIPAHDHLFIETKTEATLTLYDMQGKQWWQQANSIGTQVCNTEQLTSGMYILHIATATATATLKVMVW